jgi:hypothetical protein
MRKSRTGGTRPLDWTRQGMVISIFPSPGIIVTDSTSSTIE